MHAYTEDRRKVFGRAGAEIMKEGCGGGKRKMGRWERRKEEDGKVGAASSQSGDALSQQRRSHFMRAVCILQLLVLTRGHYHILLQLPPPFVFISLRSTCWDGMRPFGPVD